MELKCEIGRTCTHSIFAGGYFLGTATVAEPEKSNREIVAKIEEWAGESIPYEEEAAAVNGYLDGRTGDSYRLNCGNNACKAARDAR